MKNNNISDSLSFGLDNLDNLMKLMQLKETASNLMQEGNKYYNSKQYYEAVKCYDKAIDLNAGYANAFNNKGQALNILGKHEESIKCYDKVIELAPTCIGLQS